MRPVRLLSVIVLAAAAFAAQPALAKSRIKDIVEFEGVRENQLVGYGIVVGLNGTGDALRNAPFTKQSLEAMLERLGVNVRDANLNTKNVAAVMVTAKLPPFAAPGAQIDASVSALGDAKSLLGGTLLVTPLMGADGQAYAVAQGTVQTGSVSAGGASGSTVLKGVPTAGRIAGGASVEREIGFRLANMGQMRMTLRNPDFTTARRIADVINVAYAGSAVAENPTIVSIRPPAGQDMVSFMAQVENLTVEPDNGAKVVIDEVAGVIVMGDAVRVSTVAIQQGNLTITVREQPAVSQPGAFSRGGETTVVPQSDISVSEETGRQFLTVRSGASLANLVAGLNALGVTPRDMISILQTIKAAGALQAEIEVM
ncbi:MAG: flagellar biosynthesis protein FlgA [Phenylobacterium sp. RIFCSPHIGHO2_01_FULL_69_31]|uniref:flagellar basal body P-ring protein FlgI n=1 Tax=Phenylobacterium sp. RIFCSPHIGHO2_01_FULL_69_31 TaxID=1801944 RepID=UPI0008AFF8DF|nr:flagellar basal body P-ring protein FlgI [Phenylobacterium sp. RIFCSPHIGHO2_01_FULL_69_31]OHB27822.1 MAG: flagellar biosynthesis protein FlgA [Phenylobacterium sp. RIFCSPHIGHO2_01_FULL_69_31]